MQLWCQRCHCEWVNTPPLQRDKTLYFSPLQLCKVSLAICVFNLALAFSICLQNDWPSKCEIPNREESQEAPAGLGAPVNRRVQGGLARVKAYSWGVAQGLPNDTSGHLVAVQHCWASRLRARGCGMLVSKAVSCFWCTLGLPFSVVHQWIPYYVRDLLHHTDDLFQMVRLFQISLFQVTFNSLQLSNEESSQGSLGPVNCCTKPL